MDSQFSIYNKVYPVGDTLYSILDLLYTVVDEQYMNNGMSRISDLHLKVGESVRIRLDGVLQVIPEAASLTTELAEQLIFPLLPESQLKAIREKQILDLDVGFELKELGYNFRINVFYDRDGIAAVMRMLPPRIPSVDTVGFLSDEIWEQIVQLKRGLVLVTGVAGSGKSTTIASLLDYINRSEKIRLITLEDPIEYLFESQQGLVSQREVGTHVKSFAHGLHSVLRENPDVIYVGEIRNAETASLALTGAETGHLVFSTLHTRDAVGAITRILDLFPPERNRELANQLSFSLATVISQRLVPRKEGQGRCAAMEILKNTSGLGNMIRTGKWHQIYSMMTTKGSEGMMTMEQSLLELYQNGFITREVAIGYSNNPDVVMSQLPAEKKLRIR